MQRGIVAFAAICLLASPLGAQTVADQKAQVDLDNARLTELNTIRTALVGSNVTSTLATPAASVEAAELQDLVYDQVEDKLVERVKALAPKALKPILLIGSTPPTLSQWLQFRSNAAQVGENLDVALKAWKPYEVSGKQAELLGAFAIALPILGAVRSALQNESAISGASLKADDTYVGALLTAKLKAAYPTMLADEPFMLGSDGIADRAALLGDLATSCKIASDEVKSTLPIDIKIQDDAKPEVKKKAVAYQNLVTSAADCKKLSDNLLADQGGLPLSTVIKRQKEIAEQDYCVRPVVYVLAQNAALTAITNKNFLTGFGSTPANLSARVRLVYLVIHSVDNVTPAISTRGTLSCYTKRVKFDRLGKDRNSKKLDYSCEYEENGKVVAFP